MLIHKFLLVIISFGCKSNNLNGIYCDEVTFRVNYSVIFIEITRALQLSRWSLKGSVLYTHSCNCVRAHIFLHFGFIWERTKILKPHKKLQDMPSTTMDFLKDFRVLVPSSREEKEANFVLSLTQKKKYFDMMRSHWCN
jgi:hypothetical protein